MAVFGILMLYLGASTGFAFNFHFCGENLSKVALNPSSKTTTCCKKETAKNNCCKDHDVKIEVSDKQQAAQFFKLPPPVNIQLFRVEATTPALLFPSNTVLLSAANGSPPKPPGVPLYTRNCVFII